MVAIALEITKPSHYVVVHMKKSQQIIVFIAAWLGWGFDIFDGLLFNFVAPNCVPTLLGLEIGSQAAKAATLNWTGIMTAVLLLGWALGGVVFGLVADRIGRSKTLLITMLCYALGTAMCAFVPNIWLLLLCRTIASLGIGGEWAAGASLVAETVPENRRVEAGALLYTSAPFGILLATFVNAQIAGNLFKHQPEVSWRYVFLCGLIPAVLAIAIRFLVKEPASWTEQAANFKAPKLSELFTPEFWPATRSGLGLAMVALLTWWSCNAFIPVVASTLAQAQAKTQGLTVIQTSSLVEEWKSIASNSFNWGGFLGTLLTVPMAKSIGRKPMYGIYFVGSAMALFATFATNLPPETLLRMYFFIGLTVFGIFGSFTYYLPELFPTRLRSTGSGFCYNIGRVIAAVGPFVVGSIAAGAQGDISVILKVMSAIGFIPLVGLGLMPWTIETKGRRIAGDRS
jgi:MFS family permease